MQHQPVITGKLSEGRHTHNFAYDDVLQTKSHFSQSIIPSGIPRNPEYILLFWYLSACVPSQHLPPFPLCYLSRSTQPNPNSPSQPTLWPLTENDSFLPWGCLLGWGKATRLQQHPLLNFFFVHIPHPADLLCFNPRKKKRLGNIRKRFVCLLCVNIWGKRRDERKSDIFLCQAKKFLSLSFAQGNGRRRRDFDASFSFD